MLRLCFYEDEFDTKIAIRIQERLCKIGEIKNDFIFFQDWDMSNE